MGRELRMGIWAVVLSSETRPSVFALSPILANHPNVKVCIFLPYKMISNQCPGLCPSEGVWGPVRGKIMFVCVCVSPFGFITRRLIFCFF